MSIIKYIYSDNSINSTNSKRKFLPNKIKISNIGLIDKKKFKLLVPKKGHLINKPIYSGYSKNNLSSIPKDNEIILLNQHKDLLDIKFTNDELSYILNKEKKDNKNEKENTNDSCLITSYEIDKIENVENPMNIKVNQSMTSNRKYIIKNILKNFKTNKKKFQFGNKTERFNQENYNQYLSKYLPGPCDYTSEKTLNLLSNKKNNRYKSLFYSPKKKEQKIIGNSPGPGSYDTLSSFRLNKTQIGITLDKKEKRFINLNTKYLNDLGPGEYFKNINFNKLNKAKFNNIKPLPQEIKLNKVIKKYINTYDKKEYEVPGPGKYNIKSCFNKINLLNKNKEINKRNNEKLIPEDVLQKYIIEKRNLKLNKSNIIINNIILKNKKYLKKNNSSVKNKSFGSNNKKIGITLPFVSKSKRIAFLDSSINKHNPGPCYYQNYY